MYVSMATKTPSPAVSSVKVYKPGLWDNTVKVNDSKMKRYIYI